MPVRSPALPLLCEPDGPEAWSRYLRRASSAGGKDRGNGHRSASRDAASARGGRRNVEGREAGTGECDRG